MPIGIIMSASCTLGVVLAQFVWTCGIQQILTQYPWASTKAVTSNLLLPVT
jgi:hypothetical protein